ncbi:MAG: hypothetical protein AB1792_01600 [Candidatus Zixiibacteriota bacterium]
MKTRPLLLWLLALIITLASAYYQRATGPTWPLTGTVTLNGREIHYKLPRSHEGSGKARISVIAPDTLVFGFVKFAFQDYPGAWRQTAMLRHGDTLVAELPGQEPLKVMPCQVYLVVRGSSPVLITKDLLKIRFKGYTPRAALIPHIVFMFAAMLFSTRAGLETLTGGRRGPTLASWTVVTLFIGGIALGALVTYYAFHLWWTGWPVGTDLTDNKTAIALLIWLFAWLRVRKHPRRRVAVIVAAALMLVIFLIPHSM